MTQPPPRGPGEEPDPAELNPEEPVPLPIDGTLDLHAFHPREVKELVPEYLRQCRTAGILDVRVVHGKGTGALRRTVHAVLERLDFVDTYRLAGEDGGSWGATLVRLHPAPKTAAD